MPNKLNVGHGISRGANAFVNSYMQVKQMKQQEKLQKNAFIVSTLVKQLEDDNLPYSERAKILDSIPQLLGVTKMERPLSQMMGLDKFNEKEVEDPNSPPTPAIPEQKANFEGETPRFAREAVAEGEGGYTGTTQQGELTPLIIRKKVALEIKKAEDVADVSKQKKLWEIQYRLQKDILNKGGYRYSRPGTFDAEGNYFMNSANEAGDVKSVNLGKVTPDIIRKVELSADKPSAFIREREDYWESQGKSPEEASRLALADGNDKFKLMQEGKNAYITSVNQGNAGTKPPTAAANMTNADRDRGVLLDLQKDVDINLAESKAANEEVVDLITKKEKASLEAVEADRKFEQIAAEFTPADPEYKAAVTDKNNKRKVYNDLEEAYASSRKKETLAKSKLTGAEARLKSLGQGGSLITPKIKEAIDLVRSNNAEKTKTMSDEQIYNYLKAQGKIK